MHETPYINHIHTMPDSYGPQGFISDLDTHSETQIAHNIAFHVYRFQNFGHLWSREWIVQEPELELATRWLQKDVHPTRSRSRVGAVIRVWWLIHNIDGDDFKLVKVVDEAWELTEDFRVQAEIRKEEERAFRMPDFIRNYLSKNETATAAEIARTTTVDRKTVNQALGRLCKSGELVKVSRGVYQLRGDKWWL